MRTLIITLASVLAAGLAVVVIGVALTDPDTADRSNTSTTAEASAPAPTVTTTSAAVATTRRPAAARRPSTTTTADGRNCVRDGQFRFCTIEAVLNAESGSEYITAEDGNGWLTLTVEVTNIGRRKQDYTPTPQEVIIDRIGYTADWWLF